MNSTNNLEMKRVNKTLLISWFAIIVILLVAYSVEVMKGERTLQYIVQFAMSMIIPYMVCIYYYYKNKEWEYFGYIVVVGYSFMYAFAMFTGATQMVSSYILPLLCFLILYHRPGLLIFSLISAIIVNIATLIYQIQIGSITVSNSKDVEIRFAVIMVSFAGGIVSAKLYDNIHSDNKRYIAELADKNREIQDMAIQTIATIANTIDAKDEYTRGHSKRVAEYSVAIAKELGMTELEINNLRSIALLHDIGKIGVPDSVLNKPGRLTDAEYELMKQHTVIGADILKDIKMFHGIDIGARYHHERYDGKGYPDKKAGEEIPRIARIIAVADAFDAMTSNRVYRKQLDLDFVLQELKKCKGTQFDPEIADAMIRLLEERHLRPSTFEKTEKMSDVSKIWSRVMKTEEDKYKEKSHMDELTGLYGRKHGEQLIKEAIESNKGTLIVFDVDHFRKINGEAGFLFGDIVLRTVSRCMDRIEHEKILARYGGDEFVAFLPDITDREAVEKLLDKFYEEIKTERDNMRESKDFTVSVGVCICTEIKNVYQDCFLDADRALYISKTNGGNRYTFYEKNRGDSGNSNSQNADLLRLQDFVMNPVENEQYIDNLSPELHQAVERVSELIKGEETPIQIILFTAKSNEGVNLSLEKYKEVMECLENAISKSIKGKDLTLKFSNTQRMILLTKTHTDGVRAVSTQVMKEYYKLNNNKEISVTFDSIEFT